VLSRPTTAPPFPYTTLFRSGHGVECDGKTLDLVPRPLVPRSLEEQTARDLERLRGFAEPFLPDLEDLAQSFGLLDLVESVFDPQDRKSTRLNSSHVKISYAV